MEPPKLDSDRARIPSLDGLRAPSILLVIAAHASVTRGCPERIYLWLLHVGAGALGVRCFFVISGFLITTLLLREERKLGSISLSAFYTRRILRIFPAYYFYILVLVLLGYVSPGFRLPASAYWSAATFTTHLWGHQQMDSAFMKTWFLIHTWSLSVEEQFYLVWPACLFFLKPGQGWRRRVVIWTIMLTPLVRLFMMEMNWNIFLTGFLFPNADSLMFGCMLALALHSQRLRMTRLFAWHPTLCRIVALLVICCPSNMGYRSALVLSPTIQGAAIAYLIGSYTLIHQGAGYWLLNRPALMFLGGLSYSLYLWQQLVFSPESLMKPFWFQLFPQNLGFALLFAVISYYMIERPFLKLKTRFSRLPTAAGLPGVDTLDKPSEPILSQKFSV